MCALCCRQECKKLREELREEHEEDKASALVQLAQSKEQELSSARESWQRKVEDLLEQVRTVCARWPAPSWSLCGEE